MTPKGADLEATDLIEVSTIESGSYVTRSITGQELIDAIPLPPTGLTVGTTPIASGTIGRVLFQGTGNVLQQSSSLFWDSTNNRLGIGTSSPSVPLEVNGSANIQTLTIGLGNSAVSTNTALGNLTLRDNTTGFSNTAAGYQALRNNTTGSSNTAFGVQSLVNNLTGTNNVGVGQSSLLTNTSGSNITAIGWNAGGSNTTGSNNIFIGFNSTGVSNTESNRTWIGNSSTATTWLAGNVLINTTTDAGFRLDVNGTARVQTNLNVGSTSFTSTSTPNFISLGGTYGDGSNFGSKIKLLDSGATQWGIGVSSATGINYYGTNHFFYGTSSNESIQIRPSSSNSATTSPSYLDLGSSYSSVAGSNLKLRLFGTTYGIGVSAGAVDYVAPKHVFYTGNVLINTTTDAGFRLDVNGTARVNNDFTIGSNRYLKAFRWTQDDVTKSLQLESNSNYNVDSVNVISLNNSLLNNTKNLINIGLSSTVGTQSSGSTDAFNVFNIIPTYNMPFGTHTIKGIYYNPTLTAMVGTTHHAFHSTSGRIRFENLPTSATGLSAGDIWNDGGTLKIV